MIRRATQPGEDRTIALDDSLDRLAGIGPKTAMAVGELGVRTIRDLLMHLPRRWEDRTRLTRLDEELRSGDWILVRGRVASPRVRRIRRRNLTMVDGVLADGFGTVPVIWFNQPWIGRRLGSERPAFFFGQLREDRRGKLQLINPEVEEDDGAAVRVVPVYPRLGPLGGRRLRKIVSQALSALGECRDPLTPDIRARFALPELAASLRYLHDPGGGDSTSAAAIDLDDLNHGTSSQHRRLAFDELLSFACEVTARRDQRIRSKARAVDRTTSRRVMETTSLPFELTRGQRRVVDEIADDLSSDVPMGRLLQGDVGSGKTVVAALAVRMAVEAGMQAAIMVPTEVLAEQHATTFARYLGPVGCAPALMTASQPSAHRRVTAAGLARGSVQTVVGTHALFQDCVTFRDLGLVVIDEQHRFGVGQRAALAAKGRNPHQLVMTATPIPRSLALTVYGDLDLSVIDELPPGRHPVRTVVRAAAARPKLYSFLGDEVAAGGRVFIVYPAIDTNDASQMAALAEHEEAVRKGCPAARVGVVHGRLSRERREEVIAQFRSGRIQILLATTVIEVGVDVPEATVMVIESADRFGLSQLHQLRGRVGRGTRMSWCVLITAGDVAGIARRRLRVLCDSQDGFEIAEADLEIRGPGELTGTRQWGPAGFRFANLVRDAAMIRETREVARGLAANGDLKTVGAALAAYHRTAGEVPVP